VGIAMTEEPPEVPMSWLAFIGGVVVSLLAGAALNIVAGVAALAIAMRPAGGIVGLLPGVALAFMSRRIGRGDFAQGMLLGACLIALVGGICGYNLGGGLNFK
jgi:hypothetical protein